MSCAHLERCKRCSTVWMVLKFYLGTANIHMHHVSKLQLDLTVQLGGMGFASGLICTGRMSENLGLGLSSCFVNLGLPSWIWAFHLGFGPPSWASWQTTS